MLNGFNSIAKIYDQLAKIIFGRAIAQSQLHFLNKVPDKAKVLILGGGTGWILNYLLKMQPEVEVWYIEASTEMITMAKTYVTGVRNVHFIHGTEENIPSHLQYDVVITNFYLDLFTEEKLTQVIRTILSAVKQDYSWFVTDFVNQGKWWQIILLKLMYLFFRTIAGIESNRLPDWHSALHRQGLKLETSESFYQGFINATIFRNANVSITK